MSSITAHVLDVSKGRPAMGLTVLLHILAGPDDWLELGRGQSDNDGRVRSLLPSGSTVKPGVYRLTFETGAFFKAAFIESFFPRVDVEFTVVDAGQHYHVPLLISPFGYTVYRGT